MESKKAEKGRHNYYWYAIGGLAVLVLLVFLWKIIAVRNVETRMETQKQALIERSQQVISENTRTLLHLTTTPLVWSVRKEMIRENLDQINEYFVRFVREPNVRQIVLAKTDGTIAVATDKKLEGQSISSLYPPDVLERNEITVNAVEGGDIRIVAPIMGLSGKLGVLVMVYTPQQVSLE